MMDTRGNWHSSPEIGELLRKQEGKPPAERPVITLTVGQTVEVIRGDDKLLAIFKSADKNKVTLQPVDEPDKVRPYLELAEQVLLYDRDRTKVKAQVWDNRNGMLILRTLPI